MANQYPTARKPRLKLRGQKASHTIQEGQGERYTTTVWDGAGRVRAVGGSNPGSTGGYWGRFTIYDVMGRPVQQTNPAEINGGWAPVGDDAAGWILNSPNEFDWK